MRKTQPIKRGNRADDLKAEYHFDYRKAEPNRFAGEAGKNCTVVVLDADISKVFSTSKSVNTALCALIAAMPRKAR